MRAPLALLAVAAAVAANAAWGARLGDQFNAGSMGLPQPLLTKDLVANGNAIPGSNVAAKQQDPNPYVTNGGPEKKSKAKSESFGYDAAGEKSLGFLKKKSKNKSDRSKDESEKKLKKKSKDEAKKAKKKRKSYSAGFDVVPAKTITKESMPAVDSPDGYVQPKNAKPVLPAVDSPDGYVQPKNAKPVLPAVDSPDGDFQPKNAKPVLPAVDSTDGDVQPKNAKPVLPAVDSTDGDVQPKNAKPVLPAVDSPDGDVPPKNTQPQMSASDSPDGYAAPKTAGPQTMSAADTPDGNATPMAAEDTPDGYTASKKPKPKAKVQSLSDMVPTNVNPAVKTICAKTDNQAVCEMAISKLPAAGQANPRDTVGSLTLAVDAVRAKIVEAKNAATDLIHNPSTDKLSQGAISDCLEMYDDMNLSFDAGLAALKRGDRPSASTAFDAARTDVDTCDNGFLDRPELKPVMSSNDNILAQLTSNVLALNDA